MKSPFDKPSVPSVSGSVPVPGTPKPAKDPNTFRITVTLWIICALLFVTGLYLFLDSFSVGASAAGDAYHTLKDQTSQEVYDKFYQASYDKAEKDYHVSNHAAISVDFTQFENNLRVLEVFETDYITQGDSQSDSGLRNFFNQIKTGFKDPCKDIWLEFPGKGSITVDLDAAEFIVDNVRQYVCVRLPEPALTSLGIDEKTGVKQLLFDDNGLIKDSVSSGNQLATSMLAQGQERIRHRIENNDYLFECARTSATQILTQLIRDLNPQLPDLLIEIEFFEIEE